MVQKAIRWIIFPPDAREPPKSWREGPFCARCRTRDASHAVDHLQRIWRHPAHVQRLQDLLPQPRQTPPLELPRDRRPFAELFRQVAPGQRVRAIQKTPSRTIRWFVGLPPFRTRTRRPTSGLVPRWSPLQIPAWIMISAPSESILPTGPSIPPDETTQVERNHAATLRNLSQDSALCGQGHLFPILVTCRPDPLRLGGRRQGCQSARLVTFGKGRSGNTHLIALTDAREITWSIQQGWGGCNLARCPSCGLAVRAMALHLAAQAEPQER